MQPHGAHPEDFEAAFSESLGWWINRTLKSATIARGLLGLLKLSLAYTTLAAGMFHPAKSRVGVLSSVDRVSHYTSFSAERATVLGGRIV